MEQSLTDYFELEEVSETEPQEEETIQNDEHSEDTDSSDEQEEITDQETRTESAPASDNLISYEVSPMEEIDRTDLSEKPPEEAPSDNMETA